MLKGPPGGVDRYIQIEYSVTVCLPERHPYCMYCIDWLKYEPNYNRYSCRLTKEQIFDIEHSVGGLCPLLKEGYQCPE